MPDLRLVLFVALLTGPALAQTAPSPPRPVGENAYVHNYSRPQFESIHVFVWGDVSSPGVWRIEPGTDLVELLSAAGAARNDGVDREVESTTHLRVYREAGGQRAILFETELASLLSGASGYPDLTEGDLVEVTTERQRRPQTLQTVTQIVGAASAVLLLILRLSGVGGG